MSAIGVTLMLDNVLPRPPPRLIVMTTSSSGSHHPDDLDGSTPCGRPRFRTPVGTEPARVSSLVQEPTGSSERL